MTDAEKKAIALQELARRLAAKLWPEKARPYPHENCRNEIGREGEPCRLCEGANSDWDKRVERVRLALAEVFTS